jgi:hypothetical protein
MDIYSRGIIMAVFQDITLSWKGEEYIVPANKVMRLIAKVEDEINLQELNRDQGPPLAKVAMGYAVALEYAGAKNVTGDDVYAEFFSGGAAQSAVDAVGGIMMIMVPPSTYQPQADPKQPAKAPRKKSAPSKARTA